MKRLTWSFLGTVVRSSTQFGVLWLCAHFLGAEGLGQSSILWVVGGIALTFIEGGMGHALMAYRSLNAHHFFQMQRYQLMWAGILALLSTFVAIAISFWNQQYNWLLVIPAIVFSFPLLALGQLPQYWRQREGQIQQQAIIDITAEVLGLLSLYFSLYSGFGLWAIALRAWVLALVYALAALPVLRTWRNEAATVAIAPMPEGPIVMGNYLSAERLMNQASASMDRWIVAGTLGTAVLGLYEVAIQLTTRPMGLIGSVLGRLGLPDLTALSDQPDALRKAYYRYVRGMAWAAFPIYALLLGSAAWLVPKIMGVSYEASVGMFYALAPLGLALSIASPQGILWVALRKPKVPFFLNLAQLAIYSLLLWVGYRVGGLEGLTFSYGCVGAVICLLLDYSLRFHFAQMLPWPHIKAWLPGALFSVFLFLGVWWVTKTF